MHIFSIIYSLDIECVYSESLNSRNEYESGFISLFENRISRININENLYQQFRLVSMVHKIFQFIELYFVIWPHPQYKP